MIKTRFKKPEMCSIVKAPFDIAYKMQVEVTPSQRMEFVPECESCLVQEIQVNLPDCYIGVAARYQYSDVRAGLISKTIGLCH